MPLFPVHFCIGFVCKALMLCHSRSEHIGIIFLVDNEVAILIMVE